MKFCVKKFCSKKVKAIQHWLTKFWFKILLVLQNVMQYIILVKDLRFQKSKGPNSVEFSKQEMESFILFPDL